MFMKTKRKRKTNEKNNKIMTNERRNSDFRARSYETEANLTHMTDRVCSRECVHDVERINNVLSAWKWQGPSRPKTLFVCRHFFCCCWKKTDWNNLKFIVTHVFLCQRSRKPIKAMRMMWKWNRASRKYHIWIEPGEKSEALSSSSPKCLWHHANDEDLMTQVLWHIRLQPR